MISIFHILAGIWGRRLADWTQPRVNRRFPRLYRAYDVVGRMAAWGFVALIAVTVCVLIPIGFITWLAS